MLLFSDPLLLQLRSKGNVSGNVRTITKCNQESINKWAWEEVEG